LTKADLKEGSRRKKRCKEREGGQKARKTFARGNEMGERCKRFGEWDVAMWGREKEKGLLGEWAAHKL